MRGIDVSCLTLIFNLSNVKMTSIFELSNQKGKSKTLKIGSSLQNLTTYHVAYTLSQNHECLVKQLEC